MSCCVIGYSVRIVSRQRNGLFLKVHTHENETPDLFQKVGKSKLWEHNGLILKDQTNEDEIITSSSSSYICHGVGPLVDPFRSHVSGSLFNFWHDSFCQLGNSVSLPWVIYCEAFYLHVVSIFSCIPVICLKFVLFLVPLQFVYLFFNLSDCILLFCSRSSSLLLLFFLRPLL